MSSIKEAAPSRSLLCWSNGASEERVSRGQGRGHSSREGNWRPEHHEDGSKVCQTCLQAPCHPAQRPEKHPKRGPSKRREREEGKEDMEENPHELKSVICFSLGCSGPVSSGPLSRFWGALLHEQFPFFPAPPSPGDSSTCPSPLSLPVPTIGYENRCLVNGLIF